MDEHNFQQLQIKACIYT